MREVIIQKPKDESLTAQLVSLYQALKGATPDEALQFNLSNLNWVCPLLMLPLSAYMHATKSTHVIKDDGPIASYLQTIHFPKGISSSASLEQFSRYKKNYIPIYRGKLQSSSARVPASRYWIDIVLPTNAPNVLRVNHHHNN